MQPILISNSFPFSLVRRPMRVEPRSVGELLTTMQQRAWVSAWGHENTVALASTIACADLRPTKPRPALSLDAAFLPSLDGQSFEEVWLLSPDYAHGFRPQIGQEVPAESILGWQVLQMSLASTAPPASAPAGDWTKGRLDLLDQKLNQILVRLPPLASTPAIPAPASNDAPVPASAKTTGSKPPVERNGASAAFEEPVAFLEKRGIKIKRLPDPQPADEALDRLAMALGTKFAVMSPLLNLIKRHMQNGAGFQYRMAKLPQASVGIITQQCKEWHRMAFLHDYYYERAPVCTIHAKTSTLPNAQIFFSGQWLERFLVGVARQAAARLQTEMHRALPLQMARNVHITESNGDDFELDLLATCGPDLTFWIEGKTGDYQRYAHKYAKFAKRLGLPPSRCFMVLAEIKDEECATLSALFTMTVCNPGNFETTFTEALRASLLAALLQAVTEEPGAAVDGAAGLLIPGNA